MEEITYPFLLDYKITDGTIYVTVIEYLPHAIKVTHCKTEYIIPENEYYLWTNEVDEEAIVLYEQMIAERDKYLMKRANKKKMIKSNSSELLVIRKDK
jgi:hypothetical protein